MNQIFFILGGALIPAFIALFVTALAAGRSALTPWKGRIFGLIGIAVVAIVSSALQLYFIGPIVGSIMLGIILRQVFSTE